MPNAAAELNALPQTGEGGSFHALPQSPYRLGDVAHLQCGKGFTMPDVTLSTVVSTDTGQLIWDPPRLDCLPLSELTALPDTGPGGSFTCSRRPPYLYGDRAVLSCSAGYAHPTNVTSTVSVESGELVWTPSEIHCSPVRCLPPFIPAHGSVSDTRYQFPIGFSYVCDEGYRLNPILNSFYCSPVGRWTPSIPRDVRCDKIECPPLEAPLDGSVLLNDRFFGGVATFRCDNNFKMLRGQEKRTCQADGTWSGQDVVCGRTACSPMPDTVNVLLSNDIFNTVDCGNNRTVNVKCMPNGEWSLPFPYCGGSLISKAIPNQSGSRPVLPPVIPQPVLLPVPLQPVLPLAPTRPTLQPTGFHPPKSPPVLSIVTLISVLWLPLAVFLIIGFLCYWIRKRKSRKI